MSDRDGPPNPIPPPPKLPKPNNGKFPMPRPLPINNLDSKMADLNKASKDLKLPKTAEDFFKILNDWLITNKITLILDNAGYHVDLWIDNDDDCKEILGGSAGHCIGYDKDG